jgi:hypothetical protein
MPGSAQETLIGVAHNLLGFQRSHLPHDLRVLRLTGRSRGGCPLGRALRYLPRPAIPNQEGSDAHLLSDWNNVRLCPCDCVTHIAKLLAASAGADAALSEIIPLTFTRLSRR